MFEVPYFPMPDQDCLNALLQDEKSAFSCIGPPDVWYATSAGSPFSHVGSFEAALLHGTGPKPWQHKSVPLRDPNRYEVAWYRFSSQETPWVRCKLELTKPVSELAPEQPSRTRHFKSETIACALCFLMSAGQCAIVFVFRRHNRGGMVTLCRSRS